MTKKISLILLAAIVIILVVASQTFWVLPEGKQAVMTRASSFHKTVTEAGLHRKIPFVDEVSFLPQSWQQLSVVGEKVNTTDQQLLTFNYALAWRISDINRYAQHKMTEQTLAQTTTSALLKILGGRSLAAVNTLSAAELQDAVEKAVDTQWQASGISVQNLALTQVVYAPAFRTKALQTMQDEAERSSAKETAASEAKIAALTAASTEKAEKTLATAKAQAEQIAAETMLKTAKIYAASYGRNIAFYRYLTSLDIYRKGMQQGDNVVVLGGTTPLLQHLLNESAENLSNMPVPLAPNAGEKQ